MCISYVRKICHPNGDESLEACNEEAVVHEREQWRSPSDRLYQEGTRGYCSDRLIITGQENRPPVAILSWTEFPTFPVPHPHETRPASLPAAHLYSMTPLNLPPPPYLYFQSRTAQVFEVATTFPIKTVLLSSGYWVMVLCALHNLYRLAAVDNEGVFKAVFMILVISQQEYTISGKKYEATQLLFSVVLKKRPCERREKWLYKVAW